MRVQEIAQGGCALDARLRRSFLQRSARNLYCASLSGTTESLPWRSRGESPKSLLALISASAVGFSFLPARIVTRGFLGSWLSTETTSAVPTVRRSSPV